MLEQEIYRFNCVYLFKLKIMGKISNHPKDWIKAFNIIIMFLFVFCTFTNINWFYGLTLLTIVSCVIGYLIFGLINIFIKIFAYN